MTRKHDHSQHSNNITLRYKHTIVQTDKCNPLKNGGDDKALKRDKRNPLKIDGGDITLQIDKQTEDHYRKFVVRI